MAAALLVAAVLTGPSPIFAQETTIEIPRPDLDQLEPEIRQQIEAAQRAVEELRASQSPTNLVRAVATLGQVYHAYDLIGAAMACYEIAARGTVDLQWSYYLAHTLRDLGRFEESNVHLREVMARGGDGLAEVRYYLGANHLELGELEAAERELRAGLEIAPEDPALLAGLGEVSLALERHDEARDLLERALAAVPAANRLYYPLAQAYRGLGDDSKARELLQQFGQVGLKPGDALLKDLDSLRKGATPHTLRARIAFAAGHFDEAAAAFEKALAADREDAGAWINVATAYERLGQRAEAIEHYRGALEIEPASSTANYNLGVLLRLENDLDAAQRHLEAAIEAQPTDALAMVELALVHQSKNEWLEAARNANSARKVDPLLEQAWWIEASSLVELGQLRAALSALEGGLGHLRRSERLTAGLARLLSAAPDPALRDPTRVAQLRQSLYTARPTVDNALQLVEALSQIDQCEGASEVLAKVLETEGLEEAYGSEQVTVMRAWLEQMSDGAPCRR